MELRQKYRLGEVFNVLDSKRIPLSSKERESRRGNYPYYGAQGIIDYIDDYIFDGEYLLIAEDGENLKSQKQNIAQIARGKYWVNNHAHILESNGKCDIRYICHLLNKMDISGYITGSAQPKLNQANLCSIEVELPDIQEQKRIAEFIGNFDDKIELNRQINDNLEQQAQALFKSWFVDFEPFKDGKFEESEIGLIPEGWCVGKAEDFYEINIGKTPPRKEHEWFTLDKSQNIWVSISDLGSDSRFLFDSSEYLTDKAIQKHNIVLVPENTVLLSFKLTIGRVGIAGTQLTTNEAIARFITNSVNREYTYFLLKNFNYSKLGSTSSIATAVNSKIIKAMMVLMPNNESLLNFKKLVGPIIDGIKKNEEEILCLTELRDNLLPKLMSGELKINDLDC